MTQPGAGYSQPVAYPPTGSPVPPPVVSGPPVPELPVSGGFGYPTPSYPTPSYPVSAPSAPPATPAKRGPAVLVLAIVAAVLFLATALSTTLYITKNNAYNKKVSSSNAQIADDQKRIKDLQTQLQSAQDELSTAQQQQRGTQDQLDEITKEKQTITDCLRLLAQAGQAQQAHAANASQLANQADAKCTEAEKYLD
jgi:uncharacterized protein HemX